MAQKCAKTREESLDRQFAAFAHQILPCGIALSGVICATGNVHCTFVMIFFFGEGNYCGGYLVFSEKNVIFVQRKNVMNVEGLHAGHTIDKKERIMMMK